MDVAIRAAHLIAAAVWAGGLVFLALAAGVARSTLAEAERVEFFRRLGRRFLVVSMLAAALIAATGADMAADRLPDWDALFDTEWGRAISAKTVLFATAIALALVHGLVLGPRIRRLRLASLEDPLDDTLESRIHSLRIASSVIQVVILAATVTVLVLAADLVT